MKRLYLYIILIIGISSIGFCETEVTLATDPFPPYIIENKKGNGFHGVYIDLLDEIFSQIAGIRYTVVPRPWMRCLKDAEIGAVDGVLMLFKTPEREKFLVYTKPLLTENMKMWVLASKFPNGLEWATMQDLKKFSFVYQRGYSISKEWDQAVKDGHIEAHEVNSNEKAIELVSKNRYDIAPIIERVAYNIIKTKKLESEIIPIKKPLDKAIYYVGFSKKSPEIETIQREIIPQINRIATQR